MGKNRIFQIIFLLLFLLSVLIRLAVVGFNRDVNDPHVDAADRMLGNHSLPIKIGCWECSQPKLFHLTYAIGTKILGLVGSPPYRQNMVGEMLNFFASGALLVFVWKFIKRLPVHQNQLQPIAFALVALNPALIGINSQATSDGLLLN